MFRTALIAVLLTSTIASAQAGFPGFNPNLPEGEPTGVPGGLPPIELPLITKSSGSGFVMFDFIRNETCEVFADRVVVNKSFGGLTVVETHLINLVGDIQAVLSSAKADELTETDNFLCDAPGTFISANLNGEEVVLFSSGGCGSPKQVRNGSASQLLADLVTSYCPKTHDFGFNE